MIVIKLELWPGGDEKKARRLSTAILYNSGTGDADVGNYVFEAKKAPRFGGDTEEALVARPGRKVWKRGEVRGFPRRSRFAGEWDLLRAALNAALGRRWTPGE